MPMPLTSRSTAAALRRVLDGDEAVTRDRVRTWHSRPGGALDADLPREEHRARVLEQFKDLAAGGDPALMYPKAYGGGDDVAAGIVAFEMLAYGDLSLLVKSGVQFGLFGGAILHLGTERHHEAYLADVASVELPGAFAMTEAGHGSNVADLRTTATYDHATRELVVHTPDDDAHKEWIGNAARDGRMAAVFAQLVVDGEVRGVHAVLVPLRSEDGTVLPGIRIEDCGAKMGLNGVDNGRIWFDQVRVPVDNLLDRYGQITTEGQYHSPIENPTRRFFTMLGTLVQGRVSVAGAALNATKVAQTIAVKRALTRRQFGRPGSDEETLLLDYRTHQRRLLPDLATTYALHATQEGLRRELAHVFNTTGEPVTDRQRRELETKAAAVKATATHHATRTIQECREACGGAGYLAANRLAALKNDTDVFTTFEGDNTVLLQLAAKNLLADFRDEVGDLDPFGLARFFAGQVVATVTERTAVREALTRIADELLPGRDDEADLCDHDTQMELFSWRFEHVRSSAARRLRAGLEREGADPFDVLMDCQDHVILVARAWVDCLVLRSFVEFARACEDPAARPVLDKLVSLHALKLLEDERGWFQEHGKLSSTRSKAVVKAVNQLCTELRPHAEALVDGFAVPAACLGDGAIVAAVTEGEDDAEGRALRMVA
jgi:acyl-CoA oxidase